MQPRALSAGSRFPVLVVLGPQRWSTPCTRLSINRPDHSQHRSPPHHPLQLASDSNSHQALRSTPSGYRERVPNVHRVLLRFSSQLRFSYLRRVLVHRFRHHAGTPVPTALRVPGTRLQHRHVDYVDAPRPLARTARLSASGPRPDRQGPLANGTRRTFRAEPRLNQSTRRPSR